MAVKEILRMGHPLLRQVAEPVEQFNTESLHRLVQDMRETMLANRGAGLAAPQIGVSLRVVIFSVQNNPRYPNIEPIAETILINPSITPLDARLETGWEGCLSLPGLRGNVSRYDAVRYQGWDVTGQEICRNVTGFHARVVQHEVDHLDGILYPQRMADMSQFGFEQELFMPGREIEV